MRNRFKRFVRNFFDDRVETLPMRDRDTHSLTPAPDGLVVLVHDALEASAKKALNALEQDGELDDSWRYKLNDLVYSGAFSKEQTQKLDEKLNELLQEVARVKVHVAATRILCGADAPVSKDVLEGVKGTITASNKARPVWK